MRLGEFIRRSKAGGGSSACSRGCRRGVSFPSGAGRNVRALGLRARFADGSQRFEEPHNRVGVWTGGATAQITKILIGVVGVVAGPRVDAITRMGDDVGMNVATRV